MTRRQRGFFLTLGILLVGFGAPCLLAYRLKQQIEHERAFIRDVTIGDAAQLRAELKWGVDPNTRNTPVSSLNFLDLLKKWWQHKGTPSPSPLETALQMALRYNQTEAARILVEHGANPNLTDATGEPPLLLAICLHDLDIAHILLRQGANPNALRVTDGSCALLEAFDAGTLTKDKQGYTDLAVDLIRHGANVLIKGPQGETCLMYAAGNVELATLLIDKGVDVNAVNSDGQTALMLVEPAVASLLLTRGANVNACANDHSTALTLAAYAKDYPKVSLLLKGGADCTPEHNAGFNLLLWSVYNKQADLVFVALERGMDVNAQDALGRTVLIFASTGEDEKTVRLLLNKGASVDIRDRFGMSALMYAAQANEARLVQLLLQHGADRHLRDKEDHWTAQERARHLKAEDVVMVLKTGRVPPNFAVFPQDPNPSRLQIDANHWIICRSLSPMRADSVYDPDNYEITVRDRRGHQGTPRIVEAGKEPKMIAFREVNGQSYFGIILPEGSNTTTIIYRIAGMKLIPVWQDDHSYGVTLRVLKEGGLLIGGSGFVRLGNSQNNPHGEDDIRFVSCFQNGTVQALGQLVTPSLALP